MTTEHEAAVAAVNGRGPVVEIAGKPIEFPAQLPPGIAAAAQMQRLDVVYTILSGGDEDTLAWLLEHLYEDDLERIFEAYGVKPGDSEGERVS